jgi:tRNA wybutosine-synthesizing protein 2
VRAMRVRIVPEAMLPRAVAGDWVDRDRRPFVESGRAYIPVREGCDADQDIPERSQYRGRGYQMIGDIAVVHGGRPGNREVEELRSWCRPRGILWLKGYTGIERVPICEILYGSSGDVIHKESGIVYHIDPSRVMFSQGNREEKARIARQIRERGAGERVADMFAGIGYFTLPAAKAGARVHSMEINPVAFEYLSRNILANNLEERIQAGCGHCRSLLSGKYDRIIMGHFDAITLLPGALDHADCGATIHLHSIGDQKDRIRAIAAEAGFDTAIETHRVKKYAPGTWHLVQDVVLK